MVTFIADAVIARLPECPGVYLMKDHEEQIVYVGKAKNLKQKSSTIFQHFGRQPIFYSIPA